MNNNTVDLFQPIIADKKGSPPVVINVITTPNTMEYTGGVPSSSTKTESYVLYSILPDEIKARVKSAVEAIIASV
jgi:hypothetical protein